MQPKDEKFRAGLASLVGKPRAVVPAMVSPKTPVIAQLPPVVTPHPIQSTPASTSDSDSAATHQTQQKFVDVACVATSRPLPAAAPVTPQLVSPVALPVPAQQVQLQVQARPVPETASSVTPVVAAQSTIEPKAPKKHNNVYRGVRQT